MISWNFRDFIWISLQHNILNQENPTQVGLWANSSTFSHNLGQNPLKSEGKMANFLNSKSSLGRRLDASILNLHQNTGVSNLRLRNSFLRIKPNFKD
jgi:hypothetical protein